MRFFIEQVAIRPEDPAKAIELLTALNDQAAVWSHDHVTAKVKEVYGDTDCDQNEADLSFNYALLPGKEFEVLNYTAGDNWMQDLLRVNSVSHLGMHCTIEELNEFRCFFAGRGISVAQEVETISHTNPAIAGQRTYQYVIFDTKAILGVDLKFIVRRNVK